MHHLAANTATSFVNRLKIATANIVRRLKRTKRCHSVEIIPPLLFIIIALVVAIAAVLARFDLPLLLAVRGSAFGFFQFLAGVTDTVKSHFYLIPALVVMTIVSLTNWSSRGAHGKAMLLRAYERSAFIFISIAIPGILVNIIKQFVGRGRPRTLEEFGPYVFSPFEFDSLYQGFPSAHSATAGSIAMVIALYYSSLRVPVFIVFLILASARIAANAHYPSDVLIGYAFGAIGTLIIARFLASRSLMFHCENRSIFPILRR